MTLGDAASAGVRLIAAAPAFGAPVRVNRFNQHRGYGFIMPDGGGGPAREARP